MKKLLILFFCSTVVNLLSAQGTPPYTNDDTMYIYNYSNHALYNGQISAKDEAACWPSVKGYLASWIMPNNHPSGQWWTSLRKFTGTNVSNVPVNQWFLYPNSSTTAGLPFLPSGPSTLYGTWAGWGGYLAEYGDVDGAVLGYIAVGYHYNEGASTPCYTNPWVHTDAFMTATSFYIGNDYYLVVT